MPFERQEAPGIDARCLGKGNPFSRYGEKDAGIDAYCKWLKKSVHPNSVLAKIMRQLTSPEGPLILGVHESNKGLK